MLELSFKPKDKWTEARIDKLCEKLGLAVTMKGILKSIGPNKHWHLKKGKAKGVLEITLMLESGEIILSVHDNRKGDWEEDMMKQVKKAMQQ
ncbi:MAG: hypothetical protein U0V74_06565 [Chitinophagales bacterium]